MNRSNVVGGFLLAAAGLAGAAGLSDGILEARLASLARGEAPALAKTSLSSATAYYSTYYNVDFTCPTGWSISSIDSNASRVVLNVSKAGRSNVVIYATRNGTTSEAQLRDSWSTFSGVRAAFDASSSQSASPQVYAAFDTTVSDLHISYVQLEYATSGGSRIYDLVSGSRGTTNQFVAYSATVTDYDAHSDDYDAVGNGLDFITAGVVINPPISNPLPKAAVTRQGNLILNPTRAKIELRDATGSVRQVSSEPRIEVDPAQRWFLKIRSRQ